MKQADRQTRSYLMQLFEEHGYRPRTDFGQNFLIDINLVEFIVAQGELDSRDVVLEVGAGTGGMTAFLAQQAGHVISVEIDRHIFPLAQHSVRNFDNVTLLNMDALKNKNHFAPELLELIEKELAVDSNRRLKLIANLPYSVGTPVISNLIATEFDWDRIIATIQWELATRMGAKHGGGNNYGALSVWLQAQCEAEILKKLPPSVFWPRPKVDSAIIKLTPDRKKRARINDRPFFQDFVRRLFHHRRKLMRSVLVGMYRKELEKSDVDAILKELNFDSNVRAEQEPVERLVELANRFWERLASGEE